MKVLGTVAPEFVAEITAALIGEGREGIAAQFAVAVIDHCTYEARDNLGYIYFVRPAPIAHFAELAAPVAETIVFYAERGLNVDVDHDGHLYGVELIGRSDVIAALAAAKVL